MPAGPDRRVTLGPSGSAPLGLAVVGVLVPPLGVVCWSEQQQGVRMLDENVISFEEANGGHASLSSTWAPPAPSRPGAPALTSLGLDCQVGREGHGAAETMTLRSRA